jgi:hypothetical protein
MPKKLTDAIVRAAIDGFKVQKAHLNQRIAELRAMLNSGSPESPGASEPAPRKRRKNERRHPPKDCSSATGEMGKPGGVRIIKARREIAQAETPNQSRRVEADHRGD